MGTAVSERGGEAAEGHHRQDGPDAEQGSEREEEGTAEGYAAAEARVGNGKTDNGTFGQKAVSLLIWW